MLPLICVPCVPSRGIGRTAPRWHGGNAGLWRRGAGGYLELCSRHLSKKDGFGGCLTAGAVAEGRPRGQPLPSPTLVSGRLKLKPDL